MNRDIYAYAFKSDLSIPDMLKRLNEVGPWQWIDRDSDRYGEYIAARAVEAPHHGTAKILFDDDRYVINVALRSEEPDPQPAFDGVRKLVLDKVLPALGASDITETDDYD
jgi:hypothetical protein